MYAIILSIVCVSCLTGVFGYVFFSKVKTKARFYGINSDGKTVHIAIGLSCTYENSLVDKFLELTKYQEYVFYGTVFEENSFLGPMIHIEKID